MNFLAQIGQALSAGFGNAVSADVQAAETAAQQAFYTIAGELLVVILILGLIAWNTRK